uniref:uncharacterized protein LOC120342048 isoform X2 n=1 Tax=Styela clava TaxID=7725 RepID=UPI001939B85E|nr:uncharacterized protein LOC120342048 isoform X2 [Styela clava]
MLTGQFCCANCCKKNFSSELYICKRCHEILCASCQLHHVDIKVMGKRLHEMINLNDLISTTLNENYSKDKQLAACNAAIKEALIKNKKRNEAIERKIKTSLKQFTVKFLQMLSSHEKHLRHQLDDMAHYQTTQLTSILKNSEILMKIFDQANDFRTFSTAEDSGYISELEENYSLFDRLDVMQLMTSFANAMDGRIKFTSLSEQDMKSALKTLPDLGTVLLHKSNEGPFANEMWATRKSERRAAADYPAPSDDSVGETDPDFGVFHMGKSLGKIPAVRHKNPTYVPKYQIVNQDVTVQDEMVLPAIKKKEQRPQSAETSNMFRRLHNPFRKQKKSELLEPGRDRSAQNFTKAKEMEMATRSYSSIKTPTVPLEHKNHTKFQKFRHVRFGNVEEKRYSQHSEMDNPGIASIRCQSAPDISNVRKWNTERSEGRKSNTNGRKDTVGRRIHGTIKSVVI